MTISHNSLSKRNIDCFSHANLRTEELITPTANGSESRDYQRDCHLRKTLPAASYPFLVPVPCPRPKKKACDDPPGPSRHVHRAILAESTLGKVLELVDVPDDHVQLF